MRLDWPGRYHGSSWAILKLVATPFLVADVSPVQTPPMETHFPAPERRSGVTLSMKYPAIDQERDSNRSNNNLSSALSLVNTIGGHAVGEFRQLDDCAAFSGSRASQRTTTVGHPAFGDCECRCYWPISSRCSCWA
jgi:hypothetical protein